MCSSAQTFENIYIYNSSHSFSYLLNDTLHFDAQLCASPRALLMLCANLPDFIHRLLNVKRRKAHSSYESHVKHRAQQGAQTAACRGGLGSGAAHPVDATFGALLLRGAAVLSGRSGVLVALSSRCHVYSLSVSEAEQVLQSWMETVPGPVQPH